MHTVITQLAHDNPATYPEDPLTFIKSVTCRGLQGALMGPIQNVMVDDFLIKWYFRSNSPFITHLFPLLLHIYKKNKYTIVLNQDVHETSVGSRCETSWGPNYVTFQGRPQDFRETCFLHSLRKDIKFTLIGYSRFYAEWQRQKIQ